MDGRNVGIHQKHLQRLGDRSFIVSLAGGSYNELALYTDDGKEMYLRRFYDSEQLPTTSVVGVSVVLTENLEGGEKVVYSREIQVSSEPRNIDRAYQVATMARVMFNCEVLGMEPVYIRSYAGPANHALSGNVHQPAIMLSCPSLHDMACMEAGGDNPGREYIVHVFSSALAYAQEHAHSLPFIYRGFVETVCREEPGFIKTGGMLISTDCKMEGIVFDGESVDMKSMGERRSEYVNKLLRSPQDFIRIVMPDGRSCAETG